ncbi:MAG: NDP-sugar synthase [Actinobacteria bacterium]|nr:NDP-sugar synthase [Actinomycetota bacterium]
MRAMIMAAGLGTRLLPLTEMSPKPMVPILGAPILHHILNLLRRHNITDVVINLHHVPDAITGYFGIGEEWNMNIDYSFEPKLMGTAGGVKQNEEFLTKEGTFLVVSGDSLMDADLSALVEAHRDAGSAATLALKEVADPSQYGVVALDEQGCIHSFQEKPAPGEEISRLCNSGLYVLEPEVLERVPSGHFYDFGRQLWPEMLADGVRLGSYTLEGYWNDVGDIGAYRQGCVDALRGCVNLDREALEVRPGIWFGRRAVVDQRATLDPPVFVGAGSRVEAEANIQGPVVLGEQCIVEEGVTVTDTIAWSSVVLGRGCSLEHCIVGSHSSIRGWVKAANCVVGERCLIGEVGQVRDLNLEAGTVLWG